MSAKDKFKNAWKSVSSDAAILIGTVQIVIAVSELVVRALNRRKRQSEAEPTTGTE
jgi:hypothetical protein